MDLRRLSGWSLLLGLSALPLVSVAAGKCERLVVTGSPDAPPYLWQDPQDPKHLIGANADLLQQVAGELGLKVELLYAGKRSQALEEVRSGRMDMLADASMTIGALEWFDYIHPALVENDHLLWTPTVAKLAQPLGMTNDLQANPQSIDKPGLFLAISYNSACNDPWLRGQLAKKMTELSASGLTEAVLQRNLERWKAQLQHPVSTPKQ